MNTNSIASKYWNEYKESDRFGNSPSGLYTMGQYRSKAKPCSIWRRLKYRNILMLLAVIIAIIAMTHFMSAAAEEITYREYTVQAGDTLWEIASGIDDPRDIREVIFDLKQINGLDQSMLYVGQVIRIPER